MLAPGNQYGSAGTRGAITRSEATMCGYRRPWSNLVGMHSQYSIWSPDTGWASGASFAHRTSTSQYLPYVHFGHPPEPNDVQPRCCNFSATLDHVPSRWRILVPVESLDPFVLRETKCLLLDLDAPSGSGLPGAWESHSQEQCWLPHHHPLSTEPNASSLPTSAQPRLRPVDP
jgi:hypothetical protein